MKQLTKIFFLVMLVIAPRIEAAGWSEKKVAILLTYAKRTVPNTGLVLIHLPNVIIGSHSLKRTGHFSFESGEKCQEIPMNESNDVKEGGLTIGFKTLGGKLMELVRKRNPEVAIPATLSILDKVMIPMGDDGAPKGFKPYFLVEANKAVIDNSFLMKIGSPEAIEEELKLNQNPVNLYTNHFLVMPLKLSIIAEKLGTPDTPLSETTGFYLVTHSKGTPELIIPRSKNGNEARIAVPEFSYTENKRNFKLPAPFVMEHLMNPNLGGIVATSIIAETEQDKLETSTIRFTPPGGKAEQVVISGSFDVVEKTGALTGTVQFHASNPQDSEVVFRGELRAGTLPDSDPSLLKVGGSKSTREALK